MGKREGKREENTEEGWAALEKGEGRTMGGEDSK